MENIKKIFDKIKIEKHNSNDGKKFLDPIRNIFVQITPEEIVRQKMLTFLMKNLSVPSENILVESVRKKIFLLSLCKFLNRRKIMLNL